MRPTSPEVFFSFVSTCQIPPRKEAFIECRVESKPLFLQEWRKIIQDSRQNAKLVVHSSAFIEGAAHHGQPRCQLQDGCLDLSVPDQQMFHDVSNYHD